MEKVKQRLTQKPGRLARVLLLTFVLLGCASRIEPRPMPVTPSPAAALPATLPSLVQIKARGRLIVGTAITQPFEFHDPQSGQLVGFDVDTAEYIARKLDVELEWIEMPFAALVPSLRNQRVDMIIAAMYITPERQAVVDFAEPYLDTGLVMVIRPGLQNQVRTVQDLASLKVGVKIGATGDAYAHDLAAQGIALDVHEYKDTLDSFLDLEVGRIDVIFNDYLNTLAYLKSSRSALKIVADDAGQVHFLSRASLGIAVHKNERELLQAIDAALTNMKQDGTFDRLYNIWLSPTTDG